MRELMDYLEDRTDEMVDSLGQMVALESPSDNKAAVDVFGDYVTARFRELGAAVERVPIEERGDHRVVRWGEGEGRILILCHMDTVWPLGTVESRPFRVEEARAYGPGVYDMKGGITIALYALKALGELGHKPAAQVVVLLNSDEEPGSPTSRGLIESLARESDYALVLEPANPPQGTLKTFRKGVGRFSMHIKGKASHAGSSHAEGVSAIEELARQVMDLHSLTDYDAGVTVNVGVVAGGTRSNVVAEEACADIDLRVVTQAQGEEMVERILGLEPTRAGIELSVEGGMNRPPMERSPQIVAMFRRAKALGAELGLELKEGGTGGGSDGNFTAALGVPTLDGLGVVGAGGHAVDEHALVASLHERAALLASLLLDLPGR